MYSSKPSIVYGFHAIDRSAGLKILNQKDQFEPSSNEYDWLGPGIYFWENNLERARQYAEEDRRRSDTKIKDPIYEGARFFSKNHIQVAIINPNCIKGIFLPREEVDIDLHVSDSGEGRSTN